MPLLQQLAHLALSVVVRRKLKRQRDRIGAQRVEPATIEDGRDGAVTIDAVLVA